MRSNHGDGGCAAAMWFIRSLGNLLRFSESADWYASGDMCRDLRVAVREAARSLCADHTRADRANKDAVLGGLEPGQLGESRKTVLAVIWRGGLHR